MVTFGTTPLRFTPPNMSVSLERITDFLATVPLFRELPRAAVRGFAEHARGRRQLRLETYYREMRARHGVLLDDGAPAGGRWNFDAENRAPPKDGATFP